MKATDQQLIDAYADLGNVWKVGERFGMAGQTAYTRLRKVGVLVPMNIFTKEDDDRLRREYALMASMGKARDLAKAMGRTPQFLARQAKRLGLTDKMRKRPWLATWKYLSDEAAQAIWANFKATPLGVGAYCRKYGYDDLGFSKAMQRYFPDEWEHLLETKAPKQTKYRRGREFEYRVRDHLRTLGFFVLRSPASRSPLDLVAIRKNCVALIQCKRGGALPPAEWNELFDLAESIGALPIMAMIPASQRGVDYFRMIGRKDGSKRAQPMEPLTW